MRFIICTPALKLAGRANIGRSLRPPVGYYSAGAAIIIEISNSFLGRLPCQS
jgi:hypothetical protein